MCFRMMNWSLGRRATATATAKVTLAVLAAALAFGAFGAGPALTAIKLPEDKAVTDRPRPDYDPLGVRVGGFTIFSYIEIIGKYNDNIFAEETGTVDDLITVIHPSLMVKTDSPNHLLRFDAGAKIGRFADRNKENYEDFDVSAKGRINVLRNSNLFGELRYVATHEDRSSPDDADGVEPVEYATTHVRLGGMHEFNRLALTLSGDATGYDFDDAHDASGSEINQDDRDRTVYRMSLRAGYELAPEYEGFVRAIYNIRAYEDAIDDNGLDRDSTGYELVAGAVADFTGVTFGEVSFGYLSQDIDDAQLETVAGVSFGAKVTWNPTTLTTVKGWANRKVEETTQNTVSGVLKSTFGASVDHELLRQLLLHFEISYGLQEFEGSTREDDSFGVELGARYMLSRNYYLGLNYLYFSRDSTVASSDYERNIFMVRLGLQY